MRKEYYIQQGQVISTYTGGTQGLFSLTKFFKNMLLRFKVPFEDDCCTPNASPNGTDVTNLPIRYNQTAAKLQYYNPTTELWTNLTTF